MFGGNLDFGLILRAVDLASGPITRMAAAIGDAERVAAGARNLHGMGGALQELGTKLTAIGIGMGMAALPAIKAFKDQEEALTHLKMAFMEEGDTVSPFFADVSKQVVQLGNELPGTTADFARMAQALKEKGIAADKIAGGILSATAHMKALMPGLAPTEAAEYMATFQESLGVAEHDFEKFVDVVQRGKFAFGIEPGSMAYTLKYIGPLITQLGAGGLDGSKSFYILSGMLSQAGVSGEKLGTTLRETLTHLPNLKHAIDKNKELGPILKNAGISLEFFRDGKFMGVENLVVQLEKLRVLNDQDKLRVLKGLFGAEAMTSLAVLVKGGVDGYNAAAEKFSKQATLDQRTREMLTTLQSKWETATGNIENMLASLGRVFADEMKGVVDWIADVAAATGDWIEANEALVKPLGLAVAGASGLFVALGTGGLVLGTLAKGMALTLGPLAAFTRGTVAATAAGGRFAVASAAMVGRGIKALPGALLRAAIAFVRFQVAAVTAGMEATRSMVVGAGRSVAALAAWTRATVFTRAGLLRLATAPFRLIAAGFRLVAVGIRAASLAMWANPVALGAAAIAAAAVLVWKYWAPIRGFFVGLWRGVTEALGPVAPAFARLSAALGPVGAAFGRVVGWVGDLFGWLGRLLNPVQDVGGAAEHMGERWGRVIGNMLKLVLDLPAKLFTAGAEIVNQLWAGIASKADMLQAKFAGMVQGVRDMLPFSPAKTGPLKDLHQLKFGETIASGIRPGPVTNAMRGLATAGLAALAPLSAGHATPTLAGMAAGGGMAAHGGGGPVSVALTVNLSGEGGAAAGRQAAEALRQRVPDIVAALRAEEARQRRTGY